MKTVVITGASSGIGLATAKACIKAGHRVFATARKADDLDKLHELGATAVAMELSDKASVEAAADELLAKSGNRIDALFNNAGYGLQLAMEDAGWDELAEQHITNVIGPIHLTNRLLPAMPEGSKLIFNSSILGLITVAFRGPYCMSKYALEAAADAYRLELESAGIDVHLLQPGPIEADFRQRTWQELQKTLNPDTARLDYSNHIQRLTNPGNSPGTLPASSCAEIVLGMIEGSHRKNRYLVTDIAKKAAIAKRVMGSAFHKLARKAEPVRARSR